MELTALWSTMCISNTFQPRSDTQARPSTRFCWQHDRLATAKFSVQSLGQSSREKYPYFGDTWISLKYRVGGERKPSCQKQLDPFSHFSKTPTCDEQTDRQGHSIYRASIASHGKNSHHVDKRRKQQNYESTAHNDVIHVDKVWPAVCWYLVLAQRIKNLGNNKVPYSRHGMLLLHHIISR